MISELQTFQTYEHCHFPRGLTLRFYCIAVLIDDVMFKTSLYNGRAYNIASPMDGAHSHVICTNLFRKRSRCAKGPE